MKKAIIVSVNFQTRVIVDENFSLDNIPSNVVEQIEYNILRKINFSETEENIESFRDDLEIPYNENDKILFYINYDFKPSSSGEFVNYYGLENLVKELYGEDAIDENGWLNYSEVDSDDVIIDTLLNYSDNKNAYCEYQGEYSDCFKIFRG